MSSQAIGTKAAVWYAFSLPVCYFLHFLLSGILISSWIKLESPVTVRDVWHLAFGVGWISLWSILAVLACAHSVQGATVPLRRTLAIVGIISLGSLVIELAFIWFSVPWNPRKPWLPIALYFLVCVLAGGVANGFAINLATPHSKNHVVWVIGAMVGWAMAVAMDVGTNLLTLSGPLVN